MDGRQGKWLQNVTIIYPRAACWLPVSCFQIDWLLASVGKHTHARAAWQPAKLLHNPSFHSLLCHGCAREANTRERASALAHTMPNHTNIHEKWMRLCQHKPRERLITFRSLSPCFPLISQLRRNVPVTVMTVNIRC